MSHFRLYLSRLNRSLRHVQHEPKFLDLPLEIILQIFQYIPSDEIVKLWSKSICLNRSMAYAIGYCILKFDKLFINKNAEECVMEKKDLMKYLVLNYSDPYSNATSVYVRVLKFFHRLGLKFPTTVKTLTFCYYSKTYKSEEYCMFYNIIMILFHLDKSFLTINLNSDNWTFVMNLNTNYPPAKDIKTLCNFFGDKQLLIPQLNNIHAKSLAVKGNLFGAFDSYPKNLTQLVVDSETLITVSLGNLPKTLRMVIIRSQIELVDNGAVLPNLKICAILANDSSSLNTTHRFVRRHLDDLEFLSIKNFALTKNDLKRMKKLIGLFLYECQSLPFESFIYAENLKTFKIHNCETFGIQNLRLPSSLEMLQVEPEDMAFPLQNLHLLPSLKYISY